MTGQSGQSGQSGKLVQSGVIVGAYAASPTLQGWDPQVEREYLDGIDAIEGVRGLELPWIGELHRDPEWLLDALPPRFDLVLTDVPWAVRSVASDPEYGLASRSDRGRLLALDDARRMRDDVARIADAGGARVIAVELHSAPRASEGDAARLAESLSELSAWDWSGADLVVEHCDALVDGQAPQKGFLPLRDEIAAIAGPGVGLSINWGRSAIELRDGDAVAGQIALARESGALRGLILSGATDSPGSFGGAWDDSHAPFAQSPAFPWGIRESLLTIDRAREAIAAAGDIDWLGFKFGWMRGGPAEFRLDMIRTATEIVRGTERS